MTTLRLKRLLVTLCFALVAAGCGGSEADHGTAPTISNLTHDATPLTVSVAGAIHGTFDYVEPDGDLEIMQMDLVLPNGQPAVVPDTTLSGVSGDTQGSILFSLSLTPPLAGTYQLTLRVVDLEGNPSNDLTTTFDAQ